MRRFLLLLAGAGFFTALAASQPGVPPRSTPASYPVHRIVGTATIAAAIVPPAEVKKIFAAEIARKYTVVEVAVFPRDGHAFDIDSLDFALKLASDERSYPRTPREVASMWDEKKAPGVPSKVDVTTEVGVVYAGGNDPVYGRSGGWGTYTGVGVGIPGQPPPPPPPPSYDPAAVEARARARALPEGRTMKPVAGYLYFPASPKKHKNPAGLEYLANGTVLDLPFSSK